jgi:hypothetical protein
MGKFDDYPFQNLLDGYKYLMNDVADINYVDSTDEGHGFPDTSTYICDNVVFWALCHDYSKSQEKTQYAITTGMARAIVENVLDKYVDKPNVKYIGRGQDKEDNSIHTKLHNKREKSLGMDSDTAPRYIPGYIAFKVSLSELPFEAVHEMLEASRGELRNNFVILHDFDIACDCKGITTRALVQQYLVDNGISIQDVVNDRSKVGDDCISWMSRKRNGIIHRNKVYNKFVQMLQSCDVRRTLGSLVSSLVYNKDSKFTEKLLEYKDDGMTRVEITVYSPKLRSIEYYERQMERLLEYLDECPVHRVSFEKQWHKIVQCLDTAVAIYVENCSTFIYSHWQNAITGKMQGTVRKGVSKKEVDKLIANYSFNDRPIYLIWGKLKDNGKFDVIQTSTYRREEGCDAMTLVPGPNNGLYPNFRDLRDGAVQFDQVGLTPYLNVTINWPEKRIGKKSKPLAKISKTLGIPAVGDKLPKAKKKDDVPINEDESDTVGEGVLKEVNISACGRFTSAYSLTKSRGCRTYTVVGYGRRSYHSELVTFVTTKDKYRIRCTKAMQELVEEEIVNEVWFDIRLVRAKKVNGYRDVECELV